MLTYALAPVMPRAACALQLSRTLAHDTPGVTLTFDDGPHPEGTPEILEILARARARAMFFMIGEQVERRPELAARISAEGHVVALHGYRHHLQLRMSAPRIRDDLDRGLAAIQRATGVRPSFHRPPYGVYSPAGLDATRELGLVPLLWSRWGKDWRKFTTPRRIARRAISAAWPGDVILLHDADFYSSKGSHQRTARALEIILAELNSRKIGTVLPV